MPVLPEDPRIWEAARVGLTMVRNQELQCGAIGEARRSLEEARASAVEAPRRARDFVRWDDCLRECFSDAGLCDVEELVKLVDRAELEAHGWSLIPGRYVGVAPEEGEDGFDVEKALRAISIDTEKPNNDAAAPAAAPIVRNFEELGT